MAFVHAFGFSQEEKRNSIPRLNAPAARIPEFSKKILRPAQCAVEGIQASRPGAATQEEMRKAGMQEGRNKSDAAGGSSRLLLSCLP
jgi:hypothetical protein